MQKRQPSVAYVLKHAWTHKHMASYNKKTLRDTHALPETLVFLQPFDWKMRCRY
jgi:hypothetical protein